MVSWVFWQQWQLANKFLMRMMRQRRVERYISVLSKGGGPLVQPRDHPKPHYILRLLLDTIVITEKLPNSLSPCHYHACSRNHLPSQGNGYFNISLSSSLWPCSPTPWQSNHNQQKPNAKDTTATTIVIFDIFPKVWTFSSYLNISIQLNVCSLSQPLQSNPSS